MSLQINDENKLREWISAEVRELSDADPAVLGKYIIALLKNNAAGPETKIQSLCSEQLTQFLEDNTAGFVKRLFGHLRASGSLPVSSSTSGRPADSEYTTVVGGAAYTSGPSHPPQRPDSHDNPSFRSGRQTDAIALGPPPTNSEWSARDNRSNPHHHQHSHPPHQQPHHGGGGPPHRGGERRGGDHEGGGRSGGYERSGRGESRHGGVDHATFSRSLVIYNVPEELLDGERIADYFERFGPLEEINVRTAQKDASIRYCESGAADAAYKCPEAVMNNRFIRIRRGVQRSEFDRRGDRRGDRRDGRRDDSDARFDAYSRKRHSHHDDDDETSRETPAKVRRRHDAEAVQEAAEKRRQMVMEQKEKLRKKQERSRQIRDAYGKIRDLQRRRQELLQKQQLVVKLWDQKQVKLKESGESEANAEQKAEFMKQLKSVMDAVKTIQNTIKNTQQRLEELLREDSEDSTTADDGGNDDGEKDTGESDEWSASNTFVFIRLPEELHGDKQWVEEMMKDAIKTAEAENAVLAASNVLRRVEFFPGGECRVQLVNKLWADRVVKFVKPLVKRGDGEEQRTIPVILKRYQPPEATDNGAGVSDDDDDDVEESDNFRRG